MKFEKTHPSLKGQRIEGWSGKVLDIDNIPVIADNKFYMEQDVQEYTVDKQVVRDVIAKIEDRIVTDPSVKDRDLYICRLILKELGL